MIYFYVHTFSNYVQTFVLLLKNTENQCIYMCIHVYNVSIYVITLYLCLVSFRVYATQKMDLKFLITENGIHVRVLYHLIIFIHI